MMNDKCPIDNVTQIKKGDIDYEKKRLVSNLLIDSEPSVIYYCSSDEQIITVLEHCNREKIQFRIRSGGHHHEGACTGVGVVIIDMSCMNKIEMEYDGDTVAIGAGAKLKNVYESLKANNRIIPGGGCESVAIGGLVQGGGWGPYSRLLGMTCDTLVSAKIIVQKSDGLFQSITVSESEHRDLFHALKGAGGGNFGVLTELTFKTYPLAKKNNGYISTLEVGFNGVEISKKMLVKWMLTAAHTKNNMTTFARVYPAKLSSGPTFACTGILLNNSPSSSVNKKKEIKRAMARSLGKFSFHCLDVDASKFTVEKFEKVESRFKSGGTDSSNEVSSAAFKSGNEFLFSQHSLGMETNNEDSIPAPSSTCDGPHPHKISSFFPIKVDSRKGRKRHNYYKKIAEAIFDYMKKPTGFKDVCNCYLSLHGMGGKIMEGKSNSFYYKDRDFLFQIQAWWSDPKDSRKDEYLDWVEGLRLHLLPLTEGAFVNFPDYNVVKSSQSSLPYNENSAEMRTRLLRKFYGEDDKLLKQLVHVKDVYDVQNTFHHAMSIPLIYTPIKK